MSEYRLAGPLRRTLRGYGRTEAIYAATALLMEQFDLDAAQAVAQLVRVSKQQNDSIEAAALTCVAASSRHSRHAREPEAVDDQSHKPRPRPQRVGDGISAAVA